MADYSHAKHPGLSIGYAAGAEIHLVNAADPNILVPAGTLGEILIGGPHVGRGYLHDAEATSKAFISGLSWARINDSVENPRFFRTGDLVVTEVDGLRTLAITLGTCQDLRSWWGSSPNAYTSECIMLYYQHPS